MFCTFISKVECTHKNKKSHFLGFHTFRIFMFNTYVPPWAGVQVGGIGHDHEDDGVADYDGDDDDDD